MFDTIFLIVIILFTILCLAKYSTFRMFLGVIFIFIFAMHKLRGFDLGTNIILFNPITGILFILWGVYKDKKDNTNTSPGSNTFSNSKFIQWLKAKFKL